MTRRQRLGMLAIAVAILVVAVIALQGGDDGTDVDQAAETTTATPTATPEATSTADGEAEATATPEPTPEPTPDPGPVLTAAKVTTIEVKKGDRVRFRARSATDDEVHVHGYDISKEAPAGKTISMSFRADIEGIFEIELEHAAKEIGELRVEPR